MNCFFSTHTSILPLEAALLPFHLYLAQKRRRVLALPITCSSPVVNPASARLYKDFPSQAHYCSPDRNCASCRGRNRNFVPLKWNQPLMKPTFHTHFALDLLLHLISLLPFVSHFPDSSSNSTATGSPLDPPSQPKDPTYQSLGQAVRIQSLLDWSTLADTPSYYPIHPSVKPHLFTGLDCFSAGRIHQMRAGKS